MLVPSQGFSERLQVHGEKGGGDAACFQVRLQRSFRFAATVSGDELGRGEGHNS